jgi:uncharacterized protein (DUF433 family)
MSGGISEISGDLARTGTNFRGISCSGPNFRDWRGACALSTWQNFLRRPYFLPAFTASAKWARRFARCRRVSSISVAVDGSWPPSLPADSRKPFRSRSAPRGGEDAGSTVCANQGYHCGETGMEMTAMEWRERISTDPAVCHGQACIKGTRIPVAVVLDNLAAGLSAAEIVASYPPLRVDDVRAATAYAAELARERFVEIRQRGVA